MKLYEVLNKEYTKKDLTDTGKVLLVKGMSTKNKEDVAKIVADALLDIEIMKKRVTCMNKIEYALFSKAMKKLSCPLKEYEVNIAISMQYAFNYCYYDKENNQLVIPEDVAEAWKKIDLKAFEKRYEKLSWINDCFNFVSTLHGIAPMDVFMKMYESKKGCKISVAELKEITESIPEEYMICDIVNDHVIDYSLMNKTEAERKELFEMQSGKEYYIPSEAEIIELANEGCLIQRDSYDNLANYLKDTMKLNEEDTLLLLTDLWTRIASCSDSFVDSVQAFLSQIEVENDDQRQRLSAYCVEAYNDTNLLINRGNTPLMTMQRAKRQTPSTNTSLPLNVLRNPAKQTSVAASVAEVSKKLYPNDPCPCGSGKKYKKCCKNK